MSLNFSHIRLLTTEFAAIERLKINISSFSRLLADKKYMHNILDEFEFWPDGTTDHRVIAIERLKVVSFLDCYWSDSF